MAKRLGSRKNARSRDSRAKSRYEVLEQFDRRYIERGFDVIAGVDEAGRGALAGPVVSAAVILPGDSCLYGVDDSKHIAESDREELFDRIVARATSISIAFAQPGVIDRENILRATLMTMHRAVDGLSVHPDLVIVDGRETFQWQGRIVAVTKGDTLSLSVAAASIVAKVARDRAMRRLHRRYPRYNFKQNKGYGTKDHLEALAVHGAADVHRQTFLAKIVEKNLTMF